MRALNFRRHNWMAWGACCALLLIPGSVFGEERDDHDEGDDRPEPTEVRQASAEDEVQTLRERLTEREDETRVEDPLTIRFLGRPLVLTAQYELSLDFASRLVLGQPKEDYGGLLFDQEIEAEIFYSLTRSISFFAQLRFGQEEELDPENPEQLSGFFLERGEFWLDFQKVGGSPFSIDVGRLHFEDDRRWWWDEELDAFRVIYELNKLEVAVAVAREIAPVRSKDSFVEPEHDEVLRVIGEASWDYAADHTLQFFGLYHRDDSPTQRAGESVPSDQEDESDGEFLWLGMRAAGATDFKENGVLGYWVDLGGVIGRERVVSMEERLSERSQVEDITRRDVRGGGLDVGVTYLLALPLEPRVTAGFAIGSGDGDPNNGTDDSYRQTGLHENEPGFGGVQSFKGYGRLLDPELSNLSIVTLGLGCKLFRASSLDLVFHNYRLVDEAESLRDSQIDCHFTGESHDVGQAFDLVLALEEWKRVEFEFSVSAFRGGEAFGEQAGEWICGTFGAFRFAF